MSTSAPLLEVSQITKRFGGLTAVSEFCVTLREGEIVGIIGPNGAGKTTVFNLLTGVYTIDSGSIVLNGRNTQGSRPIASRRRASPARFRTSASFAT